MKILQVVGTFYPRRFGGQTTLALALARNLVNNGHDVTVYTTDVNDARSRHKDVRGVRDVQGIGVRYFKNLSNWLAFRRLYLPVGLMGAAKRELSRFNVVHLHEFRCLQNIIVHHYATKYGVPYVLDTHGSLPRGHGGFGIRRLLRWLFDAAIGKRILRDASRVIAETELGVGEYEAFGISGDRIVLITPPFDTEDFSRLPPSGQFRARYGLGDKRIVMFLGRIHWIKGLDFLVESFHEYVGDREDAVLAIIGPDDGYKPELDRLITGLGLNGKVLYTGYLSGDDKLSALEDADVVIQTSRYEQGAWAPLEAVLCGTPIIVSSNSGAGEDVRRIDAGYLVEYGDKGQLSDAIKYVFDNPAEARAKTLRAKKYIEENLSMKSGIAKYEKVYQEVMGAKK